MDQYIKMLGDWFKKAPALPKNATDVLVKIAPWFALIFGILGVLIGVLGIFSGIAATGFMAVLAPFVPFGPAGFGMAIGSLLNTVLLIVSSAMLLMAFPGLKARKANGWNMSFYSQVVSIVGSVIALNLVGAVISALIGFYILFQIRSYYK